MRHGPVKPNPLCSTPRPSSRFRLLKHVISALGLLLSSFHHLVPLTTNRKRRILLEQLPTTLQLHVLSFLPPNDRALSGRLVCRAAAAALRDPQHRTAVVAQPLPPHAAPWPAATADPQHVRQLPFRHKLQLLCTAAATGREANLEVALALLQPSIFPELLQSPAQDFWTEQHQGLYDPGVAATQAGHPQLLGWLVRHCPGLLDPDRVLAAAAKHCSLRGLKAVWATLDGQDLQDDGDGELDQAVMDAAAAAVVPDATDKMYWLLCNRLCHYEESTAVAAACSGDLHRFRWIHNWRRDFMNIYSDSDSDFDSDSDSDFNPNDRPHSEPEYEPDSGPAKLIERTLRDTDLSVVEWLAAKKKRKAFCGSLPPAGAGSACWYPVLLAAVESPIGGVEKLRWLQARAALDLENTSSLVKDLAVAAARAGRVEVVQHLLSTLERPKRVKRILNRGAFGEAAARSGSVAMAECLFRAGCMEFGGAVAFERAAEAGSLAMVQWLACEAGVSAAGVRLERVIGQWPGRMPAHSRDLLQAVQLLVGEAGCRGWEEAAVDSAIQRGDLALVQYLLQHMPDYRPGMGVVVKAASAGREALLELLVGHPGYTGGGSGVPGGGGQGCPYVAAAKYGDRATLEALRRLGVPWGAGGAADVIVRVKREGCTEPAVLDWLRAHGAD